MVPQAHLNRFFISIVILSIAAIGLSVLSIFVVVLPTYEKTIMDGKKEMISELTNSVCSLIDEYQEELTSQLFTPDSARALAAERISRIRYGDELKDYFWIIDHKPTMIMHPYRPDLIGSELSNYQDPNGKLLFVESVQMVEAKGDGFIDYMWQWKDDDTRIVPKLSYVKAYEPWGWIVGTGIYLEDVSVEIGQLRRHLLRITTLFSLVMGIILAFIIRQSLKIENRRRRAEQQLRLSREKYKSLVEASTEGTLLWVDQAFVFSNIRFRDLSGYDPAEVRNMDFNKLFNMEWKTLTAKIEDPKKTLSHETILNCKDGSTKEVVLSVSKINYSEQTAYILIIKEVSVLMKYEKDSQRLSEELQSSLMLMNQPLRSFSREVIKCASNLTIAQAAQLMTRKQTDVLFIHLENEIIGLINSNDMINRVLALGLDPENKVIEVMSSPVIKLPGQALLSEGLLLMKKHGLSHLAILDSDLKISGVVGFRDMIKMRQNMIGFLLREIEKAEEVDQITRIYQRLPVLVKALIESGSNTGNTTRIITAVADAIHQRLIGLAMEDLGPAPCPFAFMVLGSQGRMEQTLATDQDNALVFEDRPEREMAGFREYFLALARKVNQDLNTVGYRNCPGEIMAGNSRWNQNLTTWKGYFSEWIQNSNPKDILDAAIFFDFRLVYGEASLVDNLRQHVNQVSESKSVFFFHMAQSVVKMKVPTHLPGSSSRGEPKTEDHLDLKKVLLPVTTFIRLYAIRAGLLTTNSMDRARQLLTGKSIDPSVYEELTQSFNYITYLRIKNQAEAIARNENPDNRISYPQLDRLEKASLKKLLSDIAGLQTRLATEFSGVD